MRNNIIAGSLLFSVLYIAYCFNAYSEFLFSLPYGIHEHAQADRLALAIQYYDRGMNFFLPRTYHIYAIDGITQVEFPLQSYLAALGGLIFGRENISLSYRLITLTIGYAGLLALYLSVAQAVKDCISALFIPFFILTTPIFSYYICNYIPDAAALSICFIGFYFLLSYKLSHKYNQYIVAIVMLTLATLIKTSVGVVLIGVIGYSIFDLIFNDDLNLRRRILKTSILLALTPLLPILWYLYNLYLTEKYHSHIFLMRINPFHTWYEFKAYIDELVLKRYSEEYFTLAHYPFILFLAIAGLRTIFLNKSERSSIFLISAIVTGSSILTILFGVQLVHHDYYFLSIWQPEIIITLTILFISYRNRIIYPKAIYAFNVVVIIGITVLSYFGLNRLEKRLTLDVETYPLAHTYNSAYWMHNGANIMDSLSIDKNTNIYVLDESAPNLGLLYFDRRGINASPGSWGNMLDIRNYMKERNIKIMVCDARKIPGFEKYKYFNQVFKELYRDKLCAVYYMTI